MFVAVLFFDHRGCCRIFYVLFVTFLVFYLCASPIARTEWFLITHLAILAWLLHPTTIDLFVVMSGVAYNHIFKQDHSLWKPAPPIRLPALEILNALLKPRPQQLPLRRLFLFFLRDFCTTASAASSITILFVANGMITDVYNSCTPALCSWIDNKNVLTVLQRVFALTKAFLWSVVHASSASFTILAGS